MHYVVRYISYQEMDFFLNIFFFFWGDLRPVVSYAIVLSTLLLARSTGVLSNDFR